MNPLAAPAQQMHVLAPVLLAHHPASLAHSLHQTAGQFFKGDTPMESVFTVVLILVVLGAIGAGISRAFGRGN